MEAEVNRPLVFIGFLTYAQCGELQYLIANDFDGLKSYLYNRCGGTPLYPSGVVPHPDNHWWTDKGVYAYEKEYEANIDSEGYNPQKENVNRLREALLSSCHESNMDLVWNLEIDQSGVETIDLACIRDDGLWDNKDLDKLSNEQVFYPFA